MATSPKPDYLRYHLLDASALVRLPPQLAVPESGSTSLREYFYQAGRGGFVTTFFCLAEALGVLKRKWQDEEISTKEYFDACWWLLNHSRPRGRITVLEVPHLEAREIFPHVRALGEQHKLDVSDTLQLFALKETYLASPCPESQPVLITADGKLAKAAEQEGLLVWNCGKDRPPPP